MKLIDADALRDILIRMSHTADHRDPPVKRGIEGSITFLDAQESIDCAADNPHGLVPSKCPTCGEELVPASCMDLAMDSYRDGILYGQQHPEWGIDG